MSICIVEAYGIKFVVDPSTALLLNANYEPYLRNTVKLPKDGVFIDVGAHVGKYAFYAARQAEEGVVVAIEPIPTNVANLKKGIELNGFKNIKIFQVVCGEEEKTVELFNHQPLSNWQIAISPIEKARSPLIQASMRTLDSIVNEVGVKKINMIKMDVEKYEFEVLMGATKTLTNFNPRLQIETWAINSQKVLEFLSKFGYELTAVLYKEVTPNNYRDLLFEKK